MDDLDARVQEVLENTTTEDQSGYMLTRKKIGDRACSGAFRELETINGESIASAATKSYLLGCAIISRPHEVPNIYGTTWHNGDVYLRQRPLCDCVPVHGDRELRPHDFASQMRRFFRLKKIRLSELRRVMLQVQALRTQDEVTRAHSSTDAAGLLFEQIESRLPFSSTSTKGRGRRLEQLSWRTLARELKP
ncbi:hypothetical protein GQ600_9696 [Phytophthora cactorum]|nr:hypothetical protein GQ600_9696 [Phytophthora cactorum]